MTGVAASKVELVEVDEAVLSALVAVANRDAHPNGVTPVVSPGQDWTDHRVEWLRSFHRDRRGSLSPGTTQACRAVRAEGILFRAAPLGRTKRQGCPQAGVWICRSARQHGVGCLTLLAGVTSGAGDTGRSVRAEVARPDAVAARPNSRCYVGCYVGLDRVISIS